MRVHPANVMISQVVNIYGAMMMIGYIMVLEHAVLVHCISLGRCHHDVECRCCHGYWVCNLLHATVTAFGHSNPVYNEP